MGQNVSHIDLRSTDERLLLAYEKERCCGPGSGLMHARDAAPYELTSRGLQPEVWFAWLQRLDEIQGKAPSCCLNCCFCTMTCCAVRPRKEVKLQESIREWQKAFNDEVLIPLGMYCKTQTTAHVSQHYNGTANSHQQRHEVSFLAISLTPRDGEILRDLPHISGPFSQSEKRNRAI